MAYAPSSPEGLSSSPKSVETKQLAVFQPAKMMKELNELLTTLETFEGKVSEMTGEDKSRDMGAAGAVQGGAKRDDTTSARAKALANLPAPTVMHQEIEKHVHLEIHKLEQLSKKVARSNQPGAAFQLNELYAKIRRLNSLLASLVEASVDAIKRLFIRIFIDKQPITST